MSPISSKIDFKDGPYFWIGCMIFPYYPQIHFSSIFDIIIHEKISNPDSLGVNWFRILHKIAWFLLWNLKNERILAVKLFCVTQIVFSRWWLNKLTWSRNFSINTIFVTDVVKKCNVVQVLVKCILVSRYPRIIEGPSSVGDALFHPSIQWFLV